MKKVAIGSTNQLKVAAVHELLTQNPTFADADITGVEVSSGVREQPFSLEETVRGARNRAHAAKGHNDLGIGIEAGLIEAPYTRSGYLNVTACAVYDGAYYIGLSSAFEWPSAWITLMQREGISVREAALKTGFTKNENIAHEEGNIGILSSMRLTRKEYLKQAVLTALIQYENRSLYLRQVVCTVCNRKKTTGLESWVLVPAKEFYTDSHIRIAERYAGEHQLPLYFLSGVYGLISSESPVFTSPKGPTKRLLFPNEVGPISDKVADQLAEADIGEIHFFTKQKLQWMPYRDALVEAARRRGVVLHIHEMDDNE